MVRPAIRLLACGWFVAGSAWLVACGDVLPVDDKPSDVADASEDGGIGSVADASGDEIHEGADAAASAERLVFVTRGGFNGNLGGVDGADKKCQAAADTSATSKLHGRTFRAWISTSRDPVSGRLAHGEVPYRRVDGKPIAKGWTALTDGTLAVPLNIDEEGNEVKTASPVDLNGFVWTGTAADGSNTGDSCTEWTSASGGNTAGRLAETSSQWSDVKANTTCDLKLHLYCIEN